MFQIEFIEGTGARSNFSDLTRFAERAVRLFNFRKKSRRISPSDLFKLEVATVRETPQAEVARRFDLRNQLLGR